MRKFLFRGWVALSAAMTVSLAILGARVVAAQTTSSTGTITGRVVWGNCIRAIPLPAQPAAPDAQAQPAPAPTVTNGLPAGAVLVAVQSTGISARTDETGSFTLSEVPAGQFLTVAAGPVANAPNAIAERPNVYLTDRQTADIGTLSLGGGPITLNIACRPPLPAGVVQSGAASDVTPTTPDTSDTSP